MRLYRDFLRLRHQFPNKQGRSLLRRWTTVLFTARQGQYEELQRSHGVQAADKKAAEWRVEAKEDYGKCNNVNKKPMQDSMLTMMYFVVFNGSRGMEEALGKG